VHDLEALRQHLRISSWLVVGGSWGSTLALAYAAQHPRSVAGLVLRGVCTLRPLEIQWMYGGLAGLVRPDAWSEYVSQLTTPVEKAVPLAAYYQRLTSGDSVVCNTAVCADVVALASHLLPKALVF
jgi:proline iminopeptidase